MASREALSVRPASDLAASLALLERAERYEVTGAARVADLIAGCAVFDVVADGQTVGAFAVRVDTYSTGRELSVTAAGGVGDLGQTEAMAAWCEQQARDVIGARALSCQTRRRGLVRKLEGLGYRVSGYIMTKIEGEG